ncbi:hypothetical protein [Lewinella sp. W8]|uniref:hypothetical protein n=1 Tax=Lewinella sp. W8 TaxID=2528208 RepID=UPI0010686D35|nr:hypothetical protein [Lewinella sp. W8]MTB53063.1 hypothetical protein [Lewinella sp. W8]
MIRLTIVERKKPWRRNLMVKGSDLMKGQVAVSHDHEKVKIRRAGMDNQKTFTPTRTNSGWYQITYSHPLETGTIQADPEECSEDEIVFYFEDMKE